MSFTAQQLADELRGVVRGQLITDPLARGLYASDASPFHIMPLAVVVPADEDDLRRVVTFAHERGLPIVPRGAGTGLAGESLGAGIVLDLSANFRKIGTMTDNTVSVEPGVTLAELNAELAKHGRRFAPDPASGASCTLGGMIATNASGGTAFRHGYTRDHVASLRVIADDGSVLSTEDSVHGTQYSERIAAVELLLKENRDLIAAARPKTCFNRCGYLLHDLLNDGAEVLSPLPLRGRVRVGGRELSHTASDFPLRVRSNPPPRPSPSRGEGERANGVDLAKLLVGSEGTLGIVTRATLRTIPVAGGVCQFIVGFATLDAALRVGPELRRSPGMAACDVLDQRLLSLAKVPMVPPTVGAVVIGKIEADTEREALELGKQAVELVRGSHQCVVVYEPTCDPAELRRVAAFRDSAVSGLYAIGRGRRPEAFIEDIAVPAESVPEFVAKVQEILRSDEINASFLVHLLTGQIHTRPLLDVTAAADCEKMWPLADKVHTLALDLHGTISTQHGVGLARTPWVEKQYGPLMPVFRELKRIFDPKNILNPGKILGPDPSRPAWPMVPTRNAEFGTRNEEKTPERQTLLLWNDTTPREEAAKCNGCGDCRPRLGPVRMCPIFRATGEEAATPRAKANVLKLLDDPKRLASDEVEAISKFCVNCKMCRDECRAKVDVPKLMLEAKAAHYEEHGFNRHEWLVARAESLARLAGQFSWTINTMLNLRWTRWLLEKFFGLSRHRQLPRFTHRTFLRRAWWAGWTKRGQHEIGSKKVAYFVDVFANYCDPGIGEAAVAVLRHHGYDVHVPWRQRGSGMTPLSFGDADGARDIARYNVRALVELVRDGYTIVCTEPTAALAITQDYLALLDDADAALVAKHTVELMTFLGDLHERGELKPPTRDLPIGIGHHVPCHLKALGKPPASPTILALIAGLQVDTVDKGCSGMAGTWGLSARNRETSLKAGAEMIAAMDRPRILFGSTECSACRMQMQDATGKRTLHPVQYLAMAYGLIPIDV